MGKTKRQIGSKAMAVLLALIMVITMMPQVAFAAGGADPVEIKTAEEFAAMDAAGNYILENDITITTPYENAFSGSFNGDGHTVTLQIEETGSYVGLFSKLENGAAVMNLILCGEISSTGDSVGAVAGQINNGTSSVTIRNCWNQATVSGKRSIGGIVGTAFGDATIECCANTSGITGTGNQVGGIIGNIGSVAVTIQNCYNTATITGGNYTAGLVGQASKTYAELIIRNCYSTGNYVVTRDSYVGGLLIGLMSTNGSISNCFALGDETSDLIGTDNSTDAQVFYKSAEEMQSEAFAATLGSAFYAVPGGYPELATIRDMQTPTAAVNFIITPEDAALTIFNNGETVKTGSAGSYRLPAGNYAYTVVKDGYTSQSGTFVVSDEQANAGDTVTVDPITLAEDSSQWITVNFVTSPENADVQVKEGNTVILPENGKEYKLLNTADHNYTYEVTAEGYEDAKGTVDLTIQTQTVTLRQVTGIAISADSSQKTAYYVGDVLDTTGLKLDVTYGDGTTGMITEGFIVTGFDGTAEAASQTLTVAYKGQTTTYTISVTVKPGPLAGIAGKTEVTLVADEHGFVEDVENDWLKSDNYNIDGSAATMTIKANQPGVLSFKYKVSSEARYDKFSVKKGTTTIINGESGTIDWTEAEIAVNTDDIITFTYTKDSSSKSGDDTVWLKDFAFEDVYTLTINTTPANATVSLKNEKGVEVSGSDGSYMVTNGTYTYSISAFGYEDASGEIVVNGGDVDRQIILSQIASRKVSFEITLPEGLTGDPEIVVTYGADTMTADADGTYSLPEGTYSYTVTHPNCETVTGEVTVADQDLVVTRALVRKWVIGDYFQGLNVTAANGDYGFVLDQNEPGVLASNNQGVSSSKATLTLTIREAGKLTFKYKVGSESNYDKFLVKKGNTVLVNNVSGVINWTEVEALVDENDTVTLTYSKDSSGDKNEDTVCLKDFALTSVHTLTLTDVPEGASVEIKQDEKSIEKINGEYLLEDGEYTYIVSKFGYQDKRGTITIQGQDATVVIGELTRSASKTLRFDVTPEDCEIVVSHSTGGTMTEENGVYILPEGLTYTYTISKENYISRSGVVKLDEDETVNITLLYAGEAWDGSTKTEPSMTGDVYQISNAAELAWFAAQVNDGQATIKGTLVENINLNDKAWTAFGTYAYDDETSGFNGILDGNGFSISGLRSSEGLLSCLGPDGIVKNLNVSGTISGSGNVGGIAATSKGTIENCGFAGSVTSSASGASAGGIVGRALAGNVIQGCVNSGEVKNTCTSYSSVLNVGGIVGYTYGTVKNCYNVGAVSARTDRTNKCIGGIAGHLCAGATMVNCYNAGSVTGPEAGIGAVAGKVAGNIDNTYYLDTSCAKTFGEGTAVAIAKTDAEMKAGRFVLDLNGEGNAYLQADGTNSRYPVLYWQGGKTPELGEDLTAVIAAAAQLKLKNAEGEAVEPDADGIYSFRTAQTLTLDHTINDCTVSWASDNEGLVDTAGTIALPTEGIATVTLTATVTKGTESVQKAFTLKLWSQDEQTEEILNEIKAKLEQTSTFIQPLQAYNHTNVYQAMEQYLMRQGYEVDTRDYSYDDAASALHVTFVEAGSKVFPNTEEANIASDGTVSYYTGNGTNWGDKYAQHTGVKFRITTASAEESGEDVSVEVSVRVHIGWDQMAVESILDQAVNTITWDSIKNTNTNTSTVAKANPVDWWYTETVDGEVADDLLLPTTLAGHPVTIKWSASDPDMITVSDNGDGRYKAMLTRPRKGSDPVTFTLKAVATFNGFDEYTENEFQYQGEVQDWVTAERLFVITIAPNTEDPGEEMQAALEEKYESLLRDFVDKGKPVDTSAVTADIQMPTPGTLTTEGIMDRDYYQVKMESGNTDVLEFNGYHAEIYRPLPGQPEVIVPYTITIHRYKNPSEVYAQKTFYLTVKPLTQAEIDDAKAFMALALQEVNYWNAIKGANTDKSNVTADMEPFAEILMGEDGTLEYVRGAINLTFGGIEVDDLPGYDPFVNETWREFRTSKPTVVQYETLRITQPEYNTTVKIDSVLTHSALGKYWEKYKDTDKAAQYQQFQQLYKQPVSTEVVVIGTTGQVDPNPGPSTIKATVTIDGKGAKGFKNAGPITVNDLNPDTATAWDAVKTAFSTAGYTYTGVGSYVASITDKSGITLSDTDTKNSGWLYKVNGVLPDVYMGSYYLKNNDSIELYYTGDWTQDPAAGAWTTPEQEGPVVTLTDENGAVTQVGGKVVYDSKTGVLTITPAEGYEIKDVLVNGLSKGAVTELKGLTKNDKVTVIFAKSAEEDPGTIDTAKIIKGVEATTIKLRTVDAKKGYIKVGWTKSKGYKVDGYEVFRSVKRYSGYTKKPFFTKETSSLKATYKNTKALKSGVRYYYKVRGYREIDGQKYYTQWSNKAWWIAK